MLRLLLRRGFSSSSLNMTSATSAAVKQIETNFEKANQVPTITKLRLENGDLIHSTWKQSSLALLKPLSYLRVDPLPQEGNPARYQQSDSVPLSEGDLQCARGDLRVQIVKGPKEGEKEQEALHVYKSGRLLASYDLTALDLHGPVYFDSTFGGIAISADLKSVAFVAEGKKEKNNSYLKPRKDDAEGGEIGQDFLYVDEFGEQLVGKSDPVMVILNLDQENCLGGKFKILAREAFDKLGYRPGRLTFYKNGLIGQAVKVEPRRLGAVYCDNRPQVIFRIKLEKGKENAVEFLTSPDVSSTEARVSAQHVVWLERNLGQKRFYPGPHMSCYRLMKRSLEPEDSKNEILVDVVDKYSSEFAGLFPVGLYSAPPSRPFSSDGNFYFLSTVINDTIYPIMVNVIEGKFDVLRSAPNVTVLDVHNDVVLGSFSTPVSAPVIAYGNANQFRQDALAPFSYLLRPDTDRTTPLAPHFTTVPMDFPSPTAGHPDPAFKDVGFNAIYLSAPKDGRMEGGAPLIVWPHGGPHSVIPTSFADVFHFFHLCGYGVLLINFRGSLGRGQDSVESIMGHVGDTDVKDCYQATQECLDKFSGELNKDKVVLFGGSHGGFLVTHLAGQYPDAFHAVVARNPVCNIATMATVSDIPDWCFNEAGANYEQKSPNPAMLTSMYEASPIAHAHKVKAPTLLLIGKNDLRVPCSQGYEYYQNLKALGKAPVSMNVYDDNHPLAKVKNHVNVFIGTAVFFGKAVGLIKE